MSLKFNANQRRVLGSLMEKAATQPDYYPMTLTALTAACNQKSNRNPVMQLSEQEVEATLNKLRERKAVTFVAPAPGARSWRYRHDIEAVTAWGPREKAIMTELFLRGAQTVGELRTRCARMFDFEDVHAVKTALDAMSEDDPPIVTELPRTPGQSAVRYDHLLYPDDEQPVAPAEPAVHASVAGNLAGTGGPLSALQAEVAELREKVDALEQRLADLESQLS